MIISIGLVIGFFLPWIITLSGFDIITLGIDENFQGDSVWTLILLIFPISGTFVLLSHFRQTPGKELVGIFSVLPLLTIIIFIIWLWLGSRDLGIEDWDFSNFSLKGIQLGLWFTFLGSILLPFGLKKANVQDYESVPNSVQPTEQHVSQVNTPQKPIFKTAPKNYYSSTQVISSAVIILMYLFKLMPWQLLRYYGLINLGMLYVILVPIACVYIIFCPLFINSKWAKANYFAKQFVFWGLIGSFLFSWRGDSIGNHILSIFSAHGIAIIAAAFLLFDKKLVPIVTQLFKQVSRKYLVSVQNINDTIKHGNGKTEGPTPSEKQNNGNFCTQCGATLEKGVNFCQQCGHKKESTDIN
jgi:zinc ribbon protein